MTHHLHGVHLNTNIDNERHALINKARSRFKLGAVHLQPEVLGGLCKDKDVITAGPFPLNGPVGNTQLY